MKLFDALSRWTSRATGSNPRAVRLAAKPGLAMASLYNDVALEQVIDSLARLPDPDLVLNQAGLGRQELRKLEADDEISAALETRREAVISTPWRLEPYDSAATEWLWGQLDAHMDAFLRGSWNAVPNGYAVVEVVYGAQDGRHGIARLSEKPLEWFEPKRDGSLNFTDPGTLRVSPVDTRYKFFLTRRNPSYRNPYGDALLTRLYWPWFYHHNGWRFWMQFLERFADPLLLGQVFDEVGFVEKMTAMGYQAYVTVGRDDTLQAVTPGLSGEFERVDAALCARIQKLILGQTLTSQVGDHGSYAAAQVHNAVRRDKRNADIRLLAPTAQRLVDALWALNAFPGPAPSFIMQDDTGLELERAKRDADLVNAGILTLSEQYLLDRYDYREGDFALGGTPKPPGGHAASLAAGPGPSGQVGPAGVLLAAPKPQRFTQDQDAVETLIDAALAQAASPIPASKIRAVILAASDPDDLVERLADLYGGEDAAGFQDLVERSLFAGDVLGYTNAKQRVGGG